MAYSQSYNGYSSTNAMTLSWSFSGENISSQAQGQSSTPTYNQYASPAMNYSGKVSAAGKIKVAAALNFGFCPQIPAGEYNLSTHTVGQWTNGQISGLKLIISGAVNMTAYLSQAQASESTYQYSSSSRVNGNLIIEQVNGYYCQGAQLYMN
jgi:hypothetical protein